MKIPRFLIADISLISVGMIWGLSFTMVKFSLDEMPPMEFIGLRFLIGSVILSLIFFRHIKTVHRNELTAGLIIGIFLFLGFLTQTTGLQYTTPGKSGFITGLYIIVVPFIASIVLKKFVGWIPIIGAILALVGLGMITFSSNNLLHFNKGDLLTIFCAFFYAVQILAVEHYSLKYNVFNLTVIQIAFTGILSISYSLLFEPMQFHIPVFAWESVIFTSIMATCYAFLVQNIAQKYTSSSHAALLLGLEAPFSLLFSVLIWGEILTLKGIVGSLLIFAAILLVELGPVFLRKNFRKVFFMRNHEI